MIATTDWYDLILFTDRRNDAGDIFVQVVSGNGSPLYENTRVNEDTSPSLQSEPSAAVSSEKSLVVWIDSRPLGGVAGQRIYGRTGSLLGVFTDNEFLVSDTSEAAIKSSPKPAMAPGGQSLVAWIDRRDGTPQVWGRWLDTMQTLDGGEFQISSSVNDLKNSDLHAGYDSFDRFHVVWLDKGGSEATVKGKWFHADKSEGGTFSWTSTVNGVSVDDIAVDVSRTGELVLLFSGVGSDVRQLYLTVLAPDGTELVSPFEVTDSSVADVTDPAVSVSENGYTSAVWVDRRDGVRRVYCQILDDGYMPMGANAPVSSVVPEFMESPVTDARRGRAWFAWADPRTNGLNIYASNLIYLPTDVDDEENLLPCGYHLSQNYPNPFNPTTVIEFSLPSATEVSLEVYNVLGQRVTQLATGRFPAGEHKVMWDGTNRIGNRAASGVYFYQLSTPDFVERRKMVLLK